MISKEQIAQLTESAVKDRNIYLVDVVVSPGNRIRIEIDRDEGLSVNDCAFVSRFIEQNLDREQEDFEIQVSSPGLDQPFKILRQYRKNIGRKVEVVTKNGEKINGVLKHADE